MDEREQETTKCPTCGRSPLHTRTFEGAGYTVTFRLCVRCAETLSRVFEAMASALCQGYDEKRERYINRLMKRLDANGFDTVALRRQNNG